MSKSKSKSKQPVYSRVLLKLSGEVLGGETGIGICADAVQGMAEQICEVRDLGVQVVVVIGGAHSNNTHELARTCTKFCPRVHHVQTAKDLIPDWFQADDTVGITAGTSTPDTVICEVEHWLRELVLRPAMQTNQTKEKNELAGRIS